MVENQSDSCRFSYPANANFESSKTNFLLAVCSCRECNNCNFCKTRNPCSWLKFDNQGDESRDVLGISGTWQETDPKGAMYQAKVTIQDYNLLCNNKKCIKPT